MKRISNIFSTAYFSISLILTIATVTGAMSITSPKTLHKYVAPSFARAFFRNIPTHKLRIANLPTPIHQVEPYEYNDLGSGIGSGSSKTSILQPLWDLNITLLMKRDDMSGGVELGGNKIRKLEFLLADALQEQNNEDGTGSRKCDAVVTIGGEQSNHCRATAAACRMVGLEPHLILRTRRANQVEKAKIEENEDTFGYIGNVMFDRMVGAHIHMCTPGEYGRFGNKALVERVCRDIETESSSSSSSKKKRKAYPIPVGGSNAMGTWGYIDAVDELVQQLKIGENTSTSDDDGGDDKSDLYESIDHIVFACGSGGTATGITLGIGLAYYELNEQPPRVHAVGVCDDPDYFYAEIESIGNEMGLELTTKSLTRSLSSNDSSISSSIMAFVKGLVQIHQGKGLGYASSTQEELDFIAEFALETGVVLDPVYSGKALYQFIKEVMNKPEEFRNSRIMFWHTGGSLGVYDKIDALAPSLERLSGISRMDVYGKKMVGDD